MEAETRGFTLIELMIVVAILGILAAVSIGSYQNYLVRTQLADPLMLVSPLKENVVQTYTHSGVFPATNSLAGLSPAQSYKGKYVTSVEVEDGAIQITLGNQITAALTGRILTLRPAYDLRNPSSSMVWLCGDAAVPAGLTAAGINRTNIPHRYLPSTCR